MAYGSSGIAFIYPKPSGGLTDERLTVSTVAIALSSPSTWLTSGICRVVILDIQNNDVMVTFDGSTPTSTNGHRLYAGQNYTWSIELAKAASFIRAGSADGVVHASPATY